MTTKPITFRPSRKVHNYLKDLKNKPTEINYLLEIALKSKETKVTNDNVIEVTKPIIDIQSIEDKASNVDDFYEKPKVIKDKKYQKKLEMYREIKKRHGCQTASGERLDTKEALQYAGLENFTPID